MNRKALWIIGGVVLVAAVAAGLAAETPDGQAFGEIAIAGEALPPFQDSQSDTAIGLVAPTITGESVSVTPGSGTTLVIFLAHWCAHCQREVPAVVDWVEENGVPEGFDIIGVATASDQTAGNFPPEAWLDREGWPFPVVYDDEEATAWRTYGGGGFPYWVVLREDGTVAARFSGELPSVQAMTDFFAAVPDL